MSRNGYPNKEILKTGNFALKTCITKETYNETDSTY